MTQVEGGRHLWVSPGFCLWSIVTGHFDMNLDERHCASEGVRLDTVVYSIRSRKWDRDSSPLSRRRSGLTLNMVAMLSVFSVVILLPAARTLPRNPITTMVEVSCPGRDQYPGLGA